MAVMKMDAANKLAAAFARREGIELHLDVMGRDGAWASLEAHLSPPNLHGNHPEAAAIRIMAAKWAGYLRRHGYSR